MADFDNMAAKAKRGSEDRATADAKEAADRQAAHLVLVRAGTLLLEEGVLPIMQRAKEAFAKTNIPCVIATEFDVSNTVNGRPKVIFSCVGPAIRNRRGGTSEPQSVPVFVESDGTTIKVGIGKYHGARFPESEVGSSDIEGVEAILECAIQMALDSYYAEIDTLRQQELWH